MLGIKEQSILNEIGLIEPKKLLEKFSTLDRESGSEGEREAARYIVQKLEAYGVDHQVLWPELYLSNPKKARLRIVSEDIEIEALAPAFSKSTDDKWIDGELVYAESFSTPYSYGDIENRLSFQKDPKGKIIICEGVPSTDKVDDIINRGGVAAIFMQYGEQIHQSTCQSVWGAPSLEDHNINVRIPIVSIKHSDGKKLLESLESSKVRVAMQTVLDEGWKKCPLVLAKLHGQLDREKFVLLHGHLDSWYTGIGDNATGDASLLEIARVLKRHEKELRRSLWIAWWPGHSTGRFAGSTWFADNYAVELYNNCIAQINCESTGCKNADTYEGIMWTEDVKDFCTSLVKEVTEIEPHWVRPVRAGDYSFNCIGITSLFMVNSSLGEEKRRKLGYYHVRGSGGNMEWHTPLDNLSIVDEENFVRDTKVYIAAVLKLCNEALLPIDHRNMVRSIDEYLKNYQNIIGDKFDLSPVFQGVQNLSRVLEEFYQWAFALDLDKESTEIKKACSVIVKLQRKLIRLCYSKGSEFNHDKAVMSHPVPMLSRLIDLQRVSEEKERFLITQLIRERNRVVTILLECEELIKGML